MLKFYAKQLVLILHIGHPPVVLPRPPEGSPRGRKVGTLPPQPLHLAELPGPLVPGGIHPHTALILRRAI